MALWGIFLSSFLIGFSGAMMPGPMLGVAVEGSIREGWTAGPLTVLGHGALEIILIVVMTLGLKDFFSNPMVAGMIGLLGGIYLGWMGYGMIKSGINKSITLEDCGDGQGSNARNLVVAGALVSATNPYFVLWWAATGMEFLRRSSAFGFMGISAFFLGHILSDFTWYSVVTLAFSRGKHFISDAIYQRIMVLLGTFLMAFSVYFISGGWEMLCAGG